MWILARGNLHTLYRMQDAVARGCIADVSGCTLLYKCDECKKGVTRLIELDDMFLDYFNQIEFLRKRAEERAAQTSESKSHKPT
jgi:hypothetical protein